MRSLVPNHKNDIPEYIVIRLRHDLTPCFGALYAIWSRNVKSHRHTASIASLIRADERAEDGWSPIGGSFKIPPTPKSASGDRDRGSEV